LNISPNIYNYQILNSPHINYASQIEIVLDYHNKKSKQASLISELAIKYQNINEYIKTNLSNSRYIHTMGVISELFSLNEHYRANISHDELYLAGLLHDLAKEYKNTILIELAQEYNIDIPNHSSQIHILHAPIGAIIARELYSELITDNIYYAICDHTLGRANMTLLSQLLYIADSIEPSRNYDHVHEYRNLIYYEKASLSQVLTCISNNTINHIQVLNRPVHNQTIEMQQYYKNIVE
jgi:predicted HD superfamily hydrolase involved in NAD metabolism